MRLSELVRSGTFRLAVIFAIAVTLSTSVVFLLVYLQVATFDTKRLDAHLSFEVAQAITDKEDVLERALKLRLTRDLRRIDYAALFDANGKRLYGNVAAMPPDLLIDGRTHNADVLPMSSVDGSTAPGLFAAGKRPDGTVVLLGRSLYEVYELRHLVVRALAIGIIPATVLALIIGVIFSLRGTRRLILINETIVRIMRGDLDERLPTRGRMDDINYVAGAVNLMLDEIVRLLDQLKSVGDNIAHDLRTPLALARMRLGRTLDNPEPEQLRSTAQQTLTDLDRALATVTALLRISEVESGRRRSNFKPIDLAEVCKDVFDLFEPLAEAKGIQIFLEADAPVPILGDSDLLIEAVANLVENAIKFTPAGKEVRITAEMTEQGPVVRVADNGPGIAPEDRPLIFKRFYRSPQNQHLPGNGLGLSMAATIVEQHGLALRIEDGAWEGAVFVIASKEEPEAEPARKGSRTPHHRPALFEAS